MDELTKYKLLAYAASMTLIIIVTIVMYMASVPWESKLNSCVGNCTAMLDYMAQDCYGMSWEQFEWEHSWGKANFSISNNLPVGQHVPSN